MRRSIEIIAWTLAFALAYAQSPLYTSNQNQYFLHGLARAGVGFLRDDWLVHTADPTPLFSLMVLAVATVLPAWAFYLIYAVAMGLYLFGLVGITSSVFDLAGSTARRQLLAALVVLHSAALRYLLARLVLPEAEFVLEGGVAGQRLLGAVLQPSTIGVFLVVSVALYLRERRMASILALGIAAAVHPTYLLSAGVLLATYVAMTAWRAGGQRAAAQMALLGAAVLATVALWAYQAFGPTGAEIYARASDILIRQRIPHHAVPAEWIDVTLIFQAAMVTAALALVRRSRLFVILLVGASFILGSTVIQMASGSATLALLFPWRLSTVVVPISTACLAAAAVAAIVLRLKDRPRALQTLRIISLATVGLAVLAGVSRFVVEVEDQHRDPAAPMMAFVSETLKPGEVYLVDPKLQDFRLRTGAPIVVEAKAIPYLDREVVEWWDRVRMARNFYRTRPDRISCNGVEIARLEYGATHVVLGPKQLGLECPQLDERFSDGVYAIYQILPSG